MTRAYEIRPLERREIEPHISLLLENGFTPEIEQGEWLGAFFGNELGGFLRVFELDGSVMVEDVWVFDAHRRAGLATTLLDRARQGHDHLWLICDDDMIGFYEARGYRLMPKQAFPEALAALYSAKREWPAASDHNHNALRWTRV